MMPVLELVDTGGYRAFDEAQCRDAGRQHAPAYRAGDPFPHIVLDDFLDRSLLAAVVRDFPDKADQAPFQREQERLKYQYHPQRCHGAPTRNLFAELNSQAMLTFLSEMTGIPGLIADPYFVGAGLHETHRNGHLGIHADFNRHQEMNVQRRLNLLIYLNEDWDPDFGGALELWDRNMKECRVAVTPTMTRAVVFTTDLDSFHGHPDPLRCPPERTRRSIATYYYTAWPAMVSEPDRTTNFRPRPGSGDRRDWRIMLHNAANDWVPPIVRRRLPI